MPTTAKATPKKVPAKRNGYYYFDGKVYPSITKVIQDTIAKPALLYWYGREAARIALADPLLNEKEVMAKLALYVRQTQERGHYVHSVAEEMPNIDIGKVREEFAGYIEALRTWWEVHTPEVIGREIEVYSDRLGFGCRVDFVCRIKGEIWLIDFKSSRTGEIYPEVGLQLLAGSIALFERNVSNIEHTGAVGLAETGEYVFKETKNSEEDLIALLTLWKWLQKKGG